MKKTVVGAQNAHLLTSCFDHRWMAMADCKQSEQIEELFRLIRTAILSVCFRQTLKCYVNSKRLERDTIVIDFITSFYDVGIYKKISLEFSSSFPVPIF